MSHRSPPHLAAASAAHLPHLPPLRIGLLGLGTVGAGTLAVLRRNHHAIARRTGRHLVVTHVAARNVARAQALTGPDVQVLADAHAVATHPEVDVVVEAVGGTGPALDWVLAALASGKHVVTANKALLAEKGHIVFEAAQRHGRVVAFEGAVAVSIPIIKALREGLGGNRIGWLAGIINGTSNFILSAMRSEGLSYDQALAQAQALGYAESDPRLDVDGTDAAHKLTLLAAVAFGMPLRFADAHTEGIATLQRVDMLCAEALGYQIKLLGVARRQAHDDTDAVQLRVHPALVPARHLLAGVGGAMNGIVVQGDASGPTVHCGAGAGGEPTASAVVADLMDLARLASAEATAAHPLGRVPLMGVHPWAVDHLPVVPMTHVCTPHYLRVPVSTDRHALVATARCLAQAGVGVRSLGFAPSHVEGHHTVVLTEPASGACIQAALQSIHALPMLDGIPVHIRVETLE